MMLWSHLRGVRSCEAATRAPLEARLLGVLPRVLRAALRACTARAVAQRDFGARNGMSIEVIMRTAMSVARDVIGRVPVGSARAQSTSERLRRLLDFYNVPALTPLIEGEAPPSPTNVHIQRATPPTCTSNVQLECIRRVS